MKKIDGEDMIHGFFSLIKLIVVGTLILLWSTVFGIIISVIIVLIDFLI